MNRLALNLFTCGILLANVFSAHAQGRVDSRNLTCGDAKALVDSQEVVLMTTGGNTFDRVVKHIRFCNKTERKKRFLAPTSDKKRCFVGYTCVIPAGRSG